MNFINLMNYFRKLYSSGKKNHYARNSYKLHTCISFTREESARKHNKYCRRHLTFLMLMYTQKNNLHFFTLQRSDPA